MRNYLKRIWRLLLQGPVEEEGRM
ncbi:hypothetical protein NC653_025844 [Populus alba x Populus x berolinensis]|uniref:Uncharacterized protein n=1 Tax=Populus alba x Populus x berolinensis TaxID=444605 RepID=A0AAD6Q8H2_9ROSI|nr:hypothetical protein NC653_025844 [Populus alba x Populus x berolinensis]